MKKEEEKRYDETNPADNPDHIENGNVAMKAAQALHASWLKKPLKERIEVYEKPIKASLERVESVSFDDDDVHLNLVVRPRETADDASIMTRAERSFFAQCKLTMLEHTTFLLVLDPLEQKSGRAYQLGKVETTS